MVWYNPARNRSNAASLRSNLIDQTVSCPTQRFGITRPEIEVMQRACAIALSIKLLGAQPSGFVYNPARKHRVKSPTHGLSCLIDQ